MANSSDSMEWLTSSLQGEEQDLSLGPVGSDRTLTPLSAAALQSSSIGQAERSSPVSPDVAVSVPSEVSESKVGRDQRGQITDTLSPARLSTPSLPSPAVGPRQLICRKPGKSALQTLPITRTRPSSLSTTAEMAPRPA